MSMAMARRAWSRAGFYLNLPEVLRILRFRKRRRAFWTQYWPAASEGAGARCTTLGRGWFRIERAGTVCLVRDGEVPLDSHLMLEMMGDKTLCNALLGELGAPVVPNAVFSIDTLGAAESFLADQDAPVVVKPASGTGGGRGVTTGITTRKTLGRAARYAARYDTRLLVERQITGRSYRLLFLDGRFIDAVLREPPVVIGDGRKTIARLIREENARRLEAEAFSALSPIRINPDLRNTLRARGLSLRSVPDPYEPVVVKGAVNENDANGNHNVTPTVHPETVRRCAEIVDAIGVTLAGVDILCADIARPLDAQGGYITEINTTPGLHHHQLIARGEAPTDVGRIVLDHILSTGEGAMKLGKGAAADDARSSYAVGTPTRIATAESVS